MQEVKPNEWPPITDEKLDELDRWYEKFTSNSFELKFCDGDYLGMRRRLALADAVVSAAKSVDRYAGNPDATASFDFACYVLSKALAVYSGAISSLAQSGDTTSDSTQSPAVPDDSAPSARGESEDPGSC